PRYWFAVLGVLALAAGAAALCFLVIHAKPMPVDNGDLPIPIGVQTVLDVSCVRVLENAAAFEILSVDPGELVNNGPNFRGYKLLGKTIVSDQATRRLIADAVYRSANNGKSSAWCFEPRHVVRASVGGYVFDFVICFECHDMHIHTDSSDAFMQYPI